MKVIDFWKLLNEKRLVTLYGPKLAATRAVRELEYYLATSKSRGFPISLPVEETCKRTGESWISKGPGKPLIPANPYHYSNIVLSMFHDALTQKDHKFFMDFSNALLRREDPKYRDRFKLIDFFISQWDDVLHQKRGPIVGDEIKALRLTNDYQTLGELGLRDFIKKHSDRQGKRKKNNKK
jgi:hypothetical protein